MPRLPGLLVLRLALCVVDAALRGADRLSCELGGAAMWFSILRGVRRG